MSTSRIAPTEDPDVTRGVRSGASIRSTEIGITEIAHFVKTLLQMVTSERELITSRRNTIESTNGDFVVARNSFPFMENT